LCTYWCFTETKRWYLGLSTSKSKGSLGLVRNFPLLEQSLLGFHWYVDFLYLLFLLSKLFVLNVLSSSSVPLSLINLSINVIIVLYHVILLSWRLWLMFFWILNMIYGIDRICFESLVLELIIINYLFQATYGFELDILIVSIIRCAETKPRWLLLWFLLRSHLIHLSFILRFIPKDRRTCKK